MNSIPAVSRTDEKEAMDRRAAERASMGDRLEQRRFLERVLPRVRKTAFYLTGNREDAADLLQCALVEILRSAGSFRGESTLDRWADRVTVQTAAKQFEKKDRRKRIDEAVHTPESTSKGPDEALDAARLRKHLAMVFAALSPEHRIPVVLHYLYDYEVHEIASMTETKINTVRGRLREGLKKVRRAIPADPVLREWAEEVLKR